MALQPKVKRTLDIARYLPDIEDGMAGAVEYGTARRLRTSFQQLPVFGKTGTCSNDGTRLGWFASFSDSPQGSLVTVFLPRGRPRDLRPPRRRAYRRLLQESLGPQLLCRQGPAAIRRSRSGFQSSVFNPASCTIEQHLRLQPSNPRARQKPPYGRLCSCFEHWPGGPRSMLRAQPSMACRCAGNAPLWQPRLFLPSANIAFMKRIRG